MRKYIFRGYFNIGLAFLAGVLVMGSCKNASYSQNEAKEVTVNNWYTPTSYVKGIPVYEKFTDAEPFFHFDTDTTYVINFWATWCKPCVEELPYFEAITEQYKDKKSTSNIDEFGFSTSDRNQTCTIFKGKATSIGSHRIERWQIQQLD